MLAIANTSGLGPITIWVQHRHNDEVGFLMRDDRLLNDVQRGGYGDPLSASKLSNFWSRHCDLAIHLAWVQPSIQTRRLSAGLPMISTALIFLPSCVVP